MCHYHRYVQNRYISTTAIVSIAVISTEYIYSVIYLCHYQSLLSECIVFLAEIIIMYVFYKSIYDIGNNHRLEDIIL